MENDDILFRNLLRKYLNGECSPEEAAWLRSWYLELNESDRAQLDLPDLKAASDAMWSNIARSTRPAYPRLWKVVSAAAAILIVIAGAWYLNRPVPEQEIASSKDDISPGRTGATLTLASGRKISIADASAGQLAMEAGIKITKSENGELVYKVLETAASTGEQTLQTYNGQTQTVILPDGSRIQLNAASSITYPSSFPFKGQRSIKMTGEAYFEIAKDPAHPFSVSTGIQKVTVLGTHFNISAYQDKGPISTTLLEGSVSVDNSESGRQRILLPGQQAKGRGADFDISNVNVDDVVAWKDGFFVFDDQPLSEIMKELAKWYNVEVVFRAPELKGKKFSGSISRFKKISQVLGKLQKAGGVVFRVEKRTVFIDRPEGRR